MAMHYQLTQGWLTRPMTSEEKDHENEITQDRSRIIPRSGFDGRLRRR